MKRTYRFTATISDGKHHDGEAAGTVRANSDAEARALVADWVRQDGARKNRTWSATHIELS
ncbi:hypothetical protein ABZX95_02095 [Streptomyces sp. NPDC004232]|uniref:hypothetical protein n=1 Tax=Streptomyces sp. NPDC004232 TaxID=3154454 RepID=UPI0033B19187